MNKQIQGYKNKKYSDFILFSDISKIYKRDYIMINFIEHILNDLNVINQLTPCCGLSIQEYI